MQTIIRDYAVFSFQELSKEAQEKALDELRDVNVDFDDWHQFILEDWKEKLEAMGYTHPKIMYSGFWSQGDGACFEATIDLTTWLKAYKLTNKYRKLYAEQKRDGYVNIVIRHSGHYYHENSTSVEDEFGYHLSEKAQDQLGEIVALIESDIVDINKQIYRSLEKAYEASTSDEAIKDTIEANEYTFLEDGTMFTL